MAYLPSWKQFGSHKSASNKNKDTIEGKRVAVLKQLPKELDGATDTANRSDAADPGASQKSSTKNAAGHGVSKVVLDQ